MTCIVRFPLVDAQHNVLGYKLAWEPQPDGAPSGQADLRKLASTVARRSPEHAASWIFGDTVLFLEAAAGTLDEHALRGLVPANTVLSLTAAELAEPATLEAARALRSQGGFGICLRGTESLGQVAALLPALTHLEWGGSQPAAVKLLQSGGLRLVAPEAGRGSEALGLDGFLRELPARGPATARKLNPQSLLVLELMEMVRTDAPLKQLEAALKRDAALAYQLLRYFNSASFGFGIEVQSLRHAVTMMGYQPLYRWLALLLTNTHSQEGSPMLMQAAIIRGRFAELLGQSLLPAREAENLFVAGLFSLLDRLLGVEMDEILRQVQLADPVVQALRGREGIYGPILRVAEACESAEGGAGLQAEAAFLTSEQVNRAHVAALAWALDLRV